MRFANHVHKSTSPKKTSIKTNQHFQNVCKRRWTALFNHKIDRAGSLRELDFKKMLYLLDKHLKAEGKAVLAGARRRTRISRVSTRSKARSCRNSRKTKTCSRNGRSSVLLTLEHLEIQKRRTRESSLFSDGFFLRSQ